MKKISIILIFLLFFIPTTVLGNNKVNVNFSKCIDGDTAKFLMNGKEIKVRFLAIDTPETNHPTKDEEPYGKEASDYTCNKLKNSNNIVLEFDPKSDRKDKYDRYLAWIFVDDSLLQEELIKKGLAQVKYAYSDYKYLDDLYDAQDQAKNNKIGIWNNKFNLDSFVKNLDIKYKFILTVGIILIIIIYLIVDTKYRKKFINKTKRDVKRKIKKEFLKQIKK